MLPCQAAQGAVLSPAGRASGSKAHCSACETRQLLLLADVLCVLLRKGGDGARPQLAALSGCSGWEAANWRR